MALAERLAELVSFDTQNPDGEERPLTLRLASELKTLGARTVDQVDVGDHAYVYARFGQELPRLLINVHLDTVPANTGYTSPPHLLVRREDRLYGLGAADTKGAIAAVLEALAGGPLKRSVGHPVFGRRGARRHLHPRLSGQRALPGAGAGDRVRADPLPRRRPPPRDRGGHRHADGRGRSLVAGGHAGEPAGRAGARGGRPRRDGRRAPRPGAGRVQGDQPERRVAGGGDRLQRRADARDALVFVSAGAGRRRRRAVRRGRAARARSHGAARDRVGGGRREPGVRDARAGRLRPAAGRAPSRRRSTWASGPRRRASRSAASTPSCSAPATSRRPTAPTSS